MYTPTHFAESRSEILHDIIRKHPLATLVTTSGDDITADHIPLYLSLQAGTPGSLQGHIARANPLCRNLPEHGIKVLAIFHGPACYISPSWYPSKQQNARVVPTWNYSVVHAHGTLRRIDDPAWLRQQIEILTRQQEAAFEPPWAVSDAPDDFIDTRLRAIVGIEITLTHLTGKAKLSQNQTPENQAGIISRLKELNTPDAAEMIACMQGQTVN